jgi:hypothetical protein
MAAQALASCLHHFSDLSLRPVCWTSAACEFPRAPVRLELPEKAQLPVRGTAAHLREHGIAHSFLEKSMAQCELCGNDYDKSFVITMDGRSHVFDSFECAIHLLAPTCEHCACKIVGHGVEKDGAVYCCAQCARHEGVAELKDRA